jgi:hypothetical protein
VVVRKGFFSELFLVFIIGPLKASCGEAGLPAVSVTLFSIPTAMLPSYETSQEHRADTCACRKGRPRAPEPLESGALAHTRTVSPPVVQTLLPPVRSAAHVGMHALLCALAAAVRAVFCHRADLVLETSPCAGSSRASPGDGPGRAYRLNRPRVVPVRVFGGVRYITGEHVAAFTRGGNREI